MSDIVLVTKTFCLFYSFKNPIQVNCNITKFPLFCFSQFVYLKLKDLRNSKKKVFFYGDDSLTERSTIPDSNRSVPLDESDWRPSSPEALHAVMDICLVLRDGLRPRCCSSATVNLLCDSTCLELVTWPIESVMMDAD